MNRMRVYILLSTVMFFIGLIILKQHVDHWMFLAILFVLMTVLTVAETILNRES